MCVCEDDRESNPDFLRAHRDRVGDESRDADACQRERKEACQTGDEAPDELCGGITDMPRRTAAIRESASRAFLAWLQRLRSMAGSLTHKW
jgi:hypothetical protein